MSKVSDFQAAFRQQLAAMQEERFEQFEPRTLAWLALPPAWNDTLAMQCGFPVDALGPFLAKAREAGLCATAHNFDGGRDFWMPEPVRVEVLGELRERQGASFLHAQVVALARAIDSAAKASAGGRSARYVDLPVRSDPPLPPVSPVLRQWADLALATRGGIEPAAEKFSREIEDLLKPGHDDTGGALALMRTGTSLAQALGGQLGSAVLRGTHRIELSYRRAQDVRHLAQFIERAQQSKAFQALVGPGSEDTWALHYLGVGGVGKTMLIRYITGAEGLAAQLGWLTARVDFDHMSPLYPRTKPEQLLVSLADELRLHGGLAQFDAFDSAVKEWQAALADAPPAQLDPLANIRSAAFQNVLKAFVDGVREVPKPVVLILDTCEELAKYQPPGMMPPSITATFEILKTMQQVLRGDGRPESGNKLRVVFAGRRPLALSGPGAGVDWRMNTDGLSEGKKYLAKRKKYLRLHEIRGFDVQEADRFFVRKRERALRDSARRERRVPELGKEMRLAILQRSLATGPPAVFEAGSKDETVERYNPFDLALYTSWLFDDASGGEELTVEMIRSGRTDPYVEHRIYRRLTPVVQALLPAVVLLRRFDRKMLACASVRDAASFDEGFRELGEQEWTDYQPGVGGGETFLEVDKKLYPRLRDYYHDPDRAHRLTSAAEELGPGLRRLIADEPLVGITVDHLRAALELLPPSEAAEVWSMVEERLAREGTRECWEWANNVTGRLLGATEEEDRLDESLHAAVLATQLAATLHLQSGADCRAGWENVLATAEKHPDPTTARWLRARARFACGTITSLADVEDTLGNLFDPHLGAWRAEQLLGAGLAVAKTSSADRDAVIRTLHEIARYAELAQAVEIAAVARLAAAKGFATTPASTVLAAADACPPKSSQRWLDWIAPDSIRDRVRLELLLLQPEQYAGDEERLGAWETDAEAQLEVIDSERLASALLDLRLRAAVLPPTRLDSLAQMSPYRAGRQAACEAHRAVRPLFATVTLGYLALGRAEAALGVLNAHSSAAVSAGTDPETVRAARAMKLRVIHRMRLPEADRALLVSVAHANDPAEAMGAWPALVLNGFASPPPPEVVETANTAWLEHLHAWWRCQNLCEPNSALAAFDAMAERRLAVLASFSSSDPATTIERACLLDLREMDRTVLRWSERAKAGKVPKTLSRYLPEVRPELLHALVTPSQGSPRFDTSSVEELRFVLRGETDKARAWVANLGLRKVAEIALEEGELAALRNLQSAFDMLGLGRQLFSEAGDHAGAFICTLCRELIEAREGVRGPAVLERVYDAYAQLSSGQIVAGLPTWPALRADVETPGDYLLPALEHPSWKGWLLRTVRLLKWTEADSAAKKATAVQFLRAFYQRVPQPIAYELLLEDGDAAFAAPPAANLRYARSDVALTWLKWVALGLVAVAVLDLGAYRWLEDLHVSSKAPIPPGYLELVGGVLWAIFGLIANFYWIRSFLTGRSRLRLELSAPLATSLPGGQEQEDAMRFSARSTQIRWRLGFPPWYRFAQTLEGSGTAPRLLAYAAARERIPRVLQEKIALLRSRLTGRTWRHRVLAPLHLDASLAGEPWEAVLAMPVPLPTSRAWARTVRWLLRFVARLLVIVCAVLVSFLFALESSQRMYTQILLVGPVALIPLVWLLCVAPCFVPWRKAGREIAFFRFAPPLGSVPRVLHWRKGESFVLCNERWALTGERYWGSRLFLWAIPRYPRAKAISRVPLKADSVKVLHLIGNAVRTTAGWRLDLGQAGIGDLGSSTASAGRLLVEPSDLPLLNTALVILQGEPAEARMRSETARRQAAALKTFAADLFAAGAEAVLVVPSIAPAQATRVMSRLTRRYYRRTHALRPLLDDAALLRQWIRAEASLPDSVREEAALDVCLFARDAEHLPSRPSSPDNPSDFPPMQSPSTSSKIQ